MAGYSGTPLGKKLGIKPDTLAFISGMPDSVKKELKADLSKVKVMKGIGESNVDFIHAFASSTSDLKKGIWTWKKGLAKTGALWISWPKKTSSIASDLTGDIVREVGLAAGLVDIKVCAVNDDWSGLKFVFRKSDR